MAEKSDLSVKLFSYEDDQPREAIGLLIPRREEGGVISSTGQSNASRSTKSFSLAFLAIFSLLVLGGENYEVFIFDGQPAAPIVTVVDPYTKTESTLDYGPSDILSDKQIFIETRESFIAEGLTFIEVDLSKRHLRFFKNGVLLQSVEIMSVPNEGSWWNISSGLYEIDYKSTKQFSNSSQVYLPWLIVFQGNYMIHGTPETPSLNVVEDSFAGVGIGLSDDMAQKLYEEIDEGVPVLVHKDSVVTTDSFIYESKAPAVQAENYFVADVQNGTVLVSDQGSQTVPIASLTKLMTAVVATEELSLDSRIKVSSPTFVTSLIPRLSDRTTVSMYSLMQLLLVESSNEAAETIAGEVGKEEFISAMNKKAEKLGLTQTVFADPSGLSSENISSGRDLFKLAKYIYDEKPFIFDMTANGSLDSVYSGNEFEDLVNFNEVEEIESFIGGKVGETEAAGQTSISLHQLKFGNEERVVVVVVLGSQDRNGDVVTLLKHVHERFDG